MQHHVVPEEAQLVAIPPRLQPDLDPAHRGQVAGEGQEEPWIDRQLLLVRQAPADPPAQLGGRRAVRRLEQLDRGVERLQQRQAAHVAHEDGAAGGHRRHRPLQHPRQVVGVREVLDDRIEGHEVEVAGPDAAPVVGRAPRQLDLGQGEPVEPGADLRQGHGREVDPAVALGVGGDAEEQQAGAAAHLQHPAVLQGEQPLHRPLDPLAHLFGGDRLAGVAAVPPLDVEREVAAALRRQAAGVGLVVEGLPLGHLPGLAGGPGGVRRLPRHHVGHQRAVGPIIGSIGSRHHHGLANSGVAGQGALDLPQLDAVAADLDLMVDAAEVFEIAVRPPAGEVARAVETGARHAGEGVGDEALGGEARPVEIASSEAGAADVDLSRHAQRHRPQEGVEQVDGEVGDRHADAAAAGEIRLHQRPIGDVHGGLGDAVHVDQPWPLVAVAGKPGGEARRLQGLAAEDHVAQGQIRGLPLRGPEELAEGRRGLVQHRDPLVAQQAVEALGVAALQEREHQQPAAVEQGPPQLPHREVEGVGVEQHPDVLRSEAEPGIGRREQAVDVGVGDHHPLGGAGRAGGVDHVGRQLRVEREIQPLGAVGIERLQVRGGEQEGGAAVRAHEGDALLRIGGIDRHVGGAGLEHAQEGHHQIRRALQEQGDAIPRPHAAGLEVVSQPVGLELELAVGESLAGGAGGHRQSRRVGCAVHLGLEAAV